VLSDFCKIQQHLVPGKTRLQFFSLKTFFYHKYLEKYLKHLAKLVHNLKNLKQNGLKINPSTFSQSDMPPRARRKKQKT
jgi:hypothetical protein